jgi:hypothetical protein
MWGLKHWIAVAAGALAAVKLLGGGSMPSFAYRVPSDAPFGPRWERRRPPGMPEGTRLCSTSEEGHRILIQWLSHIGERRTWAGAGILSLARNESRAIMARPANNYDMSPGTDDLITSWGMFQFKRSAWRGLAESKWYQGGEPVAPPHVAHQLPQDATPQEEVAYPVERYRRLVEVLKARGYPNGLGMAVSIRVLHSGSGRLSQWLDTWRPGDDPVDAFERWARSSEWADEHFDIFDQIAAAKRDLA